MSFTRLEEIAQQLRSAWTWVQTDVADLSTHQGVQEGIQAVLAPYDHQIDVLVANVGVLIAGAFADMTDTQIADSLNMNFLTHIWACREVLPLMRGRTGANIVFIGSDQGSQPDIGLFPYAPAKAALHNLTKLLAREYGPDIRVNCVAPGMCRTAFVETLMERLARDDFQTDRATAEKWELQCDFIQMKRYGEPLIVHFGKEERVSGYTLVQLIETSTITAHFIDQATPEQGNAGCLNIFSCASFPPFAAAAFCQKWFDAREIEVAVTFRGPTHPPAFQEQAPAGEGENACSHQ